jgi:threonine/homoserine/homoserine lactone efflux protein
MDGRFAAFLLVAVVLIVTPGPDMALVTRNAFRGGPREVSLTAFGVGMGLLTWGLTAAAGLAAVLSASAVAYTAVRFTGAVVLGFLGLRSLLAARRGATAAGLPAASRTRYPFLQGLLNNLLNPKAGAIFVSVVPQFVRPGDSPLRLAAMVAAFALIATVWLHLYGILLAGARTRHGSRVRRTMEAATGAVLIALGLRLAVESR